MSSKKIKIGKRNQHGIKPAARAFDTTPRTVRKWLRRWVLGSMRGLL